MDETQGSTERAEGVEGRLRHLGPALRIFRQNAGLSEEALAREARIGKTQLGKYETGLEAPKVETLGRMLRVLGVEPLRFFYLVHRLGHEDRDETQESSLQFELAMVTADRLYAPWQALGYRKVIESALELQELTEQRRAARAKARQERAAEPRRD